MKRPEMELDGAASNEGGQVLHQNVRLTILIQIRRLCVFGPTARRNLCDPSGLEAPDLAFMAVREPHVAMSDAHRIAA
jgi:hypothetical protein